MFFSRVAPVYRRDVPYVALLALLIGTVASILIEQPGYTDAFYYYNAAQRMANGLGMTDAAIWTYIGAPAERQRLLKELLSRLQGVAPEMVSA